MRSLEYTPDSYGTTLYRANVPGSLRLSMTQPFREWIRAGGNTARGLRIGVLTDTHILAVKKKDLTNDAFFLIWGSEERVETAKQKLVQWMVDVANKEGSRMFARMNAYRWIKRVNREYSFEMNEQLQRYRREPDLDGYYVPEIYDIKWGFQQDPQSANVLGRNLESLDHMRMQLHCWVQCVEGDRPRTWTFRTISDEPGQAKIAARRLQKNIPLNLASIQPASHQFFLLKPICPAALKANVRWRVWRLPHIEYQLKTEGLICDKANRKTSNYAILDDLAVDNNDWRFLSGSRKFISSLDQLSEAGSITLADSISGNIINLLYIEYWFSETMKYQKFYIGYIRMRATIGICVLDFFGDKSVLSLEEFRNQIATLNRQDGEREPNPQMAYLSPRFGKRILQRFLASDKLNAANPWTNGVVSQDRDGYPIDLPGPSHLTIIFDIHASAHRIGESTQSRLKQTAKPNLRLTRSFATSLDRGDTLWENLDPKTSDQSYLTINILDLENSDLSYNLDIHRNSLPSPFELPKYLSHFGENVICAPEAFSPLEILQYGSPAFKFQSSSGSDKIHFPDLTMVTQERVWRFFCKRNPGYMVDLVLVETFTAEKTWTSGPKNHAICTGAQLKFVGNGLDSSGERLSKEEDHDGDEKDEGSETEWTEQSRNGLRKSHKSHKRGMKKAAKGMMPASTWRVRVWHQTWEQKLGENMDIKPGQRAGWEAQEWDLFPPAPPTFNQSDDWGFEQNASYASARGRVFERGSGIKEWLRVMQEVEEVIAKEVLEREKELEKQRADWKRIDYLA